MGLLRKYIVSRHPKECNRSRKLSKLWILEADKQRKVKIYKHPGTKQKYATLPKHFHIEESQCQTEGVNTSDQEEFVYNLLFDEECGWIDRRKVNLMLSKKFGCMKSPGMRNQVFLNGRKKSSFFVGKGSHKQIVALSNKQALAVLDELEDTISPKTGSEEKAIGNHSVPCPQDSCDNDGLDDTSSSENDSSSDEEDLEAFLRSNNM
jgi:hypothetical protein